MSENTKSLIMAILGLVYGIWLYDLYSEGGWSLMFTNGWKGLLVVLLFVGVVLGLDRVMKSKRRPGTPDRSAEKGHTS
ncbi:MAG: hypothetical protein NZ528_03615 [Caldilineales bacterium]|nr:hypothetical protein [Caldilineales bacterium]MDW8318126.1 hypothetical protein [Anaerolineae bacterium]